MATSSYRENLLREAELTECDKIALHHIGHIQDDESTNVLIFRRTPEMEIVAVDAKIDRLKILFNQGYGYGGEALYITAQELLGKSLKDWIPEEVYNHVQTNVMNLEKSVSKQAYTFFEYQGSFYNIAVCTNDYFCGNAASIKPSQSRDELVSLEIERVDNETASKSLDLTLSFLRRGMELQGCGENAAVSAWDVLFELMLENYDRGMVYRFNDDCSGQILHEVQGPKCCQQSYLGLRFPASDIPQSARQLYKKNKVRYIRDVTSVDVPIVSLCSNEEQPIDMTQIRSRACHKAHIIYMRNMGVVCSLSVAIVVEGELWGLLAFHGYNRPAKPSLHQRVACESLAGVVSARVESVLKKQQTARIVTLGRLFMRWRPVDHVRENLQRTGDSLLEVLDADVLVGLIENIDSQTTELFVAGDSALVPSEKFWYTMKQQECSNGLISKSTRAAIADLGLTELECPAAGFCYFEQAKTQIMIGRAWRGHDVIWGGAPEKETDKTDPLAMLNPRNSFAAYLEMSRQESRPFNLCDLNIVTMLRDQIVKEQEHSWMLALLKNDIEEANIRYLNAIERAEDNNDFLANVCHELRTPFHGVMGCLNILHDSLDMISKDEIRDLINTSLKSGNHMIHLLNDILGYSKDRHLSTGKVQEKEVYEDFVCDTIEGMRSVATNSNVEFNVHVKPQEHGCLVIVDRTKLTQIFTNITNNAIKFAGPGGRVDVSFYIAKNTEIAISHWQSDAASYSSSAFVMRGNKILRSVESVRECIPLLNGSKDTKHWLCASVKDTGIGMKPEELAKMFEPYTQSASALRGATIKGTGLGLFISASLCQRLEGFIASSSTFGVGTVFHIGVPVNVLSAASDHQEEKPTEQGNGIEIKMAGPLLIVDDNKVNLKVLERQIAIKQKEFGVDFEMITAIGGHEAIDIYKKRLPGLIIIDYQMPEMDGMETIKMIRAIECEQGLPCSYIISYTADATEKTEKLLLKSGSDEVMTKPPPKGFLSNLIKRIQVLTRTDFLSIVDRRSE